MMALALAVSSAPAVAARPTRPAATPSQFDLGYAAFSRGDWPNALRLWRPLADRGDAAAQVSLGLMYANGQGVPQDYVTAAGWYRKAAEQGDATAQLSLGAMYADGRGVPQNNAAAAGWFRKAADQGDATA